MVKTYTARGSTERGPAMQRHLQRAIDNDVDGAHTVCAHPSWISLSVTDGSVVDVLELIAEHGGTPEIDDETPVYSTGGIGINARF